MADDHAVADLVEHVRSSFQAADARSSRLSKPAMEMEGMSGAKTRHLYNNLCGRAGGCRCLQVGVWKGSSVIAALSGNDNCRVTAVDNWSEFGGPKEEFWRAAREILTPDEIQRLQVIDGDAFEAPLPDDHFDFYIYDGAHDYDSQVYAVTRMWRHLSPAAVIVIDDINFEAVRQGTADGLEAAAAGSPPAGGGRVVARFERRLTLDGSHTPLAVAEDDYWNGVGVYVISKGAGARPPAANAGEGC